MPFTKHDSIDTFMDGELKIHPIRMSGPSWVMVNAMNQKHLGRLAWLPAKVWTI